MKLHSVLVGLLSCCLLMSSCEKGEDLVTPELSLSVTDVLNIQSQESETIIEVSTNMPQWAAVCNASWLDVMKLANNLILKASPNTTGNIRTAQIVIASGGIGRTVKVIQSTGGTLPLELIPASNTIDKDGGEIRLVAKTSISNWQAKTTADWLQVVARPRQGELLVKAQANQTDETREADIEISAGKLTQTVKIRQHGQLKYYEPYNLFGQDMDKINTLERKRGSHLILVPSGPSVGNPKGVPDYTYQTLSKVFPTVKYEFLNRGTEMLYCTTLVSEPRQESLSQKADFVEWLKELGYAKNEQRSITKILVFENSRTNTELYIRIKSIEDPKDSKKTLVQDMLIFRPAIAQSQAMPTLPSLLLGPGHPGTMTHKEIAAWEAQNGGHYDKEFTENVIGHPFFFAEAPFYGRLYFKTKQEEDKVDEYLFFYLDYKVAFYTYGAMFYPTREFETLLAKEGFKLDYYNPETRSYVYKSKERRLRIICQARPFGPRLMLRMSISEYNLPKPSGIANPMSGLLKDDIISPMSKIIEDL